MNINNYVDFMYECRFKKWKHSKVKTSKSKLKEMMTEWNRNLLLSDCYVKRGQQYAQFFISESQSQRGNGKELFCYFDYKIRSKDAEKWIERKLKTAMTKYGNLSFDIPAKYKRMLNLIGKNGYQVESISTVSEFSRVPLKYLNNYKSNLLDSLRVEKLKKEDIKSVLKLFKDEFKRKPEHGRFITRKSFIDIFENSIIDQVKSNNCQYILRDIKTKKILGHFACFIKLDDQFWGRKGGLHFCLHESVQGKGMLRYLYSVLFNDMKKYRIKVYVGSTSHPAVLKQSLKLNRKPFAVCLIKDDKCYDLNHFKKVLTL